MDISTMIMFLGGCYLLGYAFGFKVLAIKRVFEVI